MRRGPRIRSWLCRHCPTRNIASNRKCAGCGIRPDTKRTSLKTRADTKARELCKREANGLCARCGKPGSDWAHRMVRKFHSVRWSRDNCDFLCRECHRYLGTHPVAFFEWLRKKGVAVSDLERRANEPWDKSYERVFAELDAWEGSL